MVARARNASSSSLKVKGDTPVKGAGPHSSGPRQLEAKSPLAKRSGKVKPSPDLAAFNRAVVNRNSLIRVVDYLHENPAAASDVWQAIENGTIGSATAGGKTDSMFFKEAPKRVVHLEMEWIAAWIIKATDQKTTKELLDSADGADPESLQRLFAFANAAPLSAPLPPSCQHKSLCARVFMRRYEAVGKRLARLHTMINPQTGRIDWLTAGAYSLTWNDEGLLVSVKHCSGLVKTVPQFWRVDRTFLFQDPWLDIGSCLHYQSAKFTLCDLFDQGTGPHAHALDKKASDLKTYAEEVQAQMEAEAAEQSKHDVADDTILTKHEEAMVAKRKEALEKARRKLEAGQKARKGAEAYHLSRRGAALGGGDPAMRSVWCAGAPLAESVDSPQAALGTAHRATEVTLNCGFARALPHRGHLKYV